MKKTDDFTLQKESLINAINHFGSRKKMADALKITVSLINTWIKAYREKDFSRMPSAKRSVQIENATGQIVNREQLRPDLFGTSIKVTTAEKLSKAICLATEALKELSRK